MRIFYHIHTFDDEEVIDHCVASVPAQTRPSDQLLIVDNASADTTLQRDFPPDTEIIRNAENLRTRGAVDVGLRYAMEHGYDRVWVLDADATPHPEALKLLMDIVAPAADRDRQRRVWRMACLPLEAPEKAIDEQSRAPKLLTYKGGDRLKPRHGIVFHDHGCYQRGLRARLWRVRPSRQARGIDRNMWLNRIVQNITGHATYRFTEYRLLGLRFQLIEMPAFRCYYLCRHLLHFWVFEFRGLRARAAAPRVLKALLLTLNFMLRPVSRKPELCACVRGLWDGIWRRMDRRYTVYGRKRAGATR